MYNQPDLTEKVINRHMKKLIALHNQYFRHFVQNLKYTFTHNINLLPNFIEKIHFFFCNKNNYDYISDLFFNARNNMFLYSVVL